LHSIQVGKFKAELSSILQRIQENGEEFVIEYGKKHQKVAILIPYDRAYEQHEPRKFGLLQTKGSFKINEDFSMSDEELLGL